MKPFPDSGTAFVSGGSGGIGAAIAARLAAEGSRVVISYNRNRDAAERTLAAVRAAGGDGEAVQLDLRDADAVRAAVDGAASRHDGLHTVVSAHGPFITMRHISRLEPALFAETMQADTFAAYNLIHAAIPHLRASRGALVAMATPAIRRYAVKDILSAAPKAAVEAVVKGVAAEEGRNGVRANCVGVGVLSDGMYHALVADGAFDDRFLEASRNNIALRRLGSAAEVAEAAVFLASARAAYVTGQTLMVDGGYAL
ncbi:SDR family NAD(P)-dependent oxidoreductase [Marinibaculum pumilum]|uniref:SDR family NAD(P)-dependent oxidoreductase n=1 Tax=Marinibaculum pumilum TaxID=1766165 RepID=A0ABV7L4Y5_9PROT